MPSHSLTHLDALVAEQYAVLSNLIEGRLVPLLVRRQLAAMAGVGPSSVASPAPRPVPPVRRASDAGKPPKRRGRPKGSGNARSRQGRGMELPRGMTDHIILKALSTAPAEGLHGRDLNSLIIAAGLTIDTAEKRKTYLRHWGLLAHDTATGFWSFRPEVRLAYPDLSMLVPKRPRMSSRSRGIKEHPVERLILEALDAGPPEGSLSSWVYEAVEGRGYSNSSVKKGLNGLRIAGVIVAGGHRGEKTWRTVDRDGLAPGTTSEETTG